MPVQKISVGNVEITSLSDGHLDFDPCVFFPTVEKNLWEPYPDATNEHHQLSLNLGSFLIRSDGQTLLVDTGLGPVPPDAPDSGWGELLNDLADKGLRPEDIDMVVMTHLHRDHVGWNLSEEGGGVVPTFPKARYWVGAKDWEFFKTEENLEKFPTNRKCVAPLEGMGLMELMEDEQGITADITAIMTPGHTPGHMSLLISSQGEKGLVLGDAAHHPVQLHELEWCAFADLDPALARVTRRALFDRIEGDNTVMAAGHFPAPGFGRLARMEGRRYWQALDLG
jgi:glyoxylase-like metal-dependent hydrolase (beta-lactamase superfamily II)